MAFDSAFNKDNWHRQASSIAIRNAIRTRRWGMRVTVYTGGSAGDYVLSYGLVNTNIQSNSNWLKVADIGETWGGGGGGASTPVNEYFVGDGVETEFTIPDADGLIQFVEQGGQVMEPDVDYSIAGPVITFTAAPPNGVSVGAYYWNGVTVVVGGVETVTGDVDNTDPLNPVTRLISAVVSVAGASIPFDFQNRSQKLFVGSAAMATPKTWAAPTNAVNALVFDFHFEISNVAAVQTMQANYLMVANADWNDVSKEWTPPAVGLYEGGATFDGTNWKLKINGPFI